MSKILSKVKFDEMDDVSHYKNYVDYLPQKIKMSMERQQNNLTFGGYKQSTHFLFFYIFIWERNLFYDW